MQHALNCLDNQVFSCHLYTFIHIIYAGIPRTVDPSCMRIPHSWTRVVICSFYSRTGFVQWQQKEIFSYTVPRKSHLQIPYIWRDFINCDKIWHHPFKKEMKIIRFVNISGGTCHFTEQYTWIMRTCISSCCHILSAVSVCECVTLCGCVSLLRWLMCFSSQVLVCQDVEGEQQHASGRVGSKAKGPSVILMQHCWAQVPW